MARMIPERTEEELRAHRPTQEADVYRLLRDTTPADWFIVFNQRLVVRPGDTSPFATECDFVVFMPERGMLIVEVKGGHIDINSTTRKWTSTNTIGKPKPHPISDPVPSMLASVQELTRQFRHRRGWTSDYPHLLLTGHALLFPDMDTPDVARLQHLDRPIAILGGKPQCQELELWIRRLFDYWADKNPTWQPLSTEGLQAVNEIFCSDNRRALRPLAQVLKREHASQMVDLTEQQTALIQMLLCHPRALIAGPAGTGKTLIALHKAKEFAKQGLRTLFVCFNKALSDFLRRNCEGVANLEALTLEKLFVRCDQAIKSKLGITAAALLQQEQGASVVPTEDAIRDYAIMRSAELVPDLRYQAIVVDEGQDFSKHTYLGLKKLLVDGAKSPWYIFYDPNQAIYQRTTEFPLKVYATRLTRNCRNTKYIHHAAYAFFRGDYVVAYSDEHGEPLRVESAPDIPSQATLIRGRVGALLQEPGLSPSQITVLVAPNEKDAYFRTLIEGGHPKGAKWMFERHWHDGTVTVDTVRRFKGLESEIVILWGLEAVSTELACELLYVALSRARLRVWIIGDEHRLHNAMRRAAVDLMALDRALTASS